MRIEQAHGYYTTNELGQYHSFDDEPAIVIHSYTGISIAGEEEQVEGYKARYDNGVRIRTERDCGEVFTSENNE